MRTTTHIQRDERAHTNTTDLKCPFSSTGHKLGPIPGLIRDENRSHFFGNSHDGENNHLIDGTAIPNNNLDISRTQI